MTIGPYLQCPPVWMTLPISTEFHILCITTDRGYPVGLKCLIRVSTYLRLPCGNLTVCHERPHFYEANHLWENFQFAIHTFSQDPRDFFFN